MNITNLSPLLEGLASGLSVLCSGLVVVGIVWFLAWCVENNKRTPFILFVWVLSLCGAPLVYPTLKTIIVALAQ